MFDSERPEFAKLLLELRDYRGLSQSQLADLAGLDHSTVSRFEKGDRKPLKETVVRLSRALNIREPDTRYYQLLEAAGYSGNSSDRTYACEEIKTLNLIYMDGTPTSRAELQTALRILIRGINRRDREDKSQ